jgi:hypothetical protein
MTDNPNKCPYCDYETTETDPGKRGWQENMHMQNVHPDIVVERLRKMGAHAEADEFAAKHGVS